jgi:DNA-binding protein HU-beta
MTRKQLVEEVQMQMTFGAITKSQIDEVLVHAFDLIREVAYKEPVTLKGFGTFKVVTRAAKVGRNPKTGVEIAIPERKAFVFKASK